MTKNEARNSIGLEVRYESFPGCDPEFGVIQSVNDYGTAFVRYDGDRHAKGTCVGDISLAGSPTPEGGKTKRESNG